MFAWIDKQDPIYVCTIAITGVEEKKWNYNACPECGRGVKKMGKTYFCDYCGLEFEIPAARYLIGNLHKFISVIYSIIKYIH